MLKLRIPPILLEIILFASLLLVGLTIYSDYGISTDEGIQRNHGVVSANHIVSLFSPDLASSYFGENVPELSEYEYRFHGVIFHLPLIAFEVISGISPRDHRLWEYRHLYTFLWYYIGAIFFYLLAKRMYGRKLGIIGVLFFILSPRIFAEGFYNVKDLPFLSGVTITLFFAIFFLEKRTLRTALLLSLATAIASNVRIAGFPLLYFFVVAFIGLRYFLLHDRRGSPIPIFFFLGLTPVLTLLFWPASWSDPVGSFVQALRLSADYTLWEGSIVYLGEVIQGRDVPWHYIPVWIGSTTPVLYVLLFIIGTYAIITSGIRSARGAALSRHDLDAWFHLLFFLVPVISVMLFDSTLYGGWRHLYFVYASFLLVSLKGLSVFLSSPDGPAGWGYARRYSGLVTGALVGLSTSTTFYWMVTNHPYQYVYFNRLASGNAAEKFDRDYWGLSARTGLEYLLSVDAGDPVRVAGNHVAQNRQIIPADERRRIWVSRAGEKADYYIETYRNVIGGSAIAEVGEELHSVRVDGNKIMTVFDLRHLAAEGIRVERFSLGMVRREAGVVHDGAMWSSGERGYLFFGPVRPLKAGTYRLRIRGVAQGPTEAWAGVMSDGGRIVHARVGVQAEQPKESGLLLETLVELGHPVSDGEVRFFVEEQDRIRIDGFELRPVEIPPKDCAIEYPLRIEDRDCLWTYTTGDGWHEYEPRHVWSAYDSELILHPPPQCAERNCRVRLQLAAYGASGDRPVTVRFVLTDGGRVIRHDRMFADERRQEVELDAGVGRNRVHLRIHVPDAVAPAELRGSADTRVLGVALFQLDIAPSGEQGGDD